MIHFLYIWRFHVYIMVLIFLFHIISITYIPFEAIESFICTMNAHITHQIYPLNDIQECLFPRCFILFSVAFFMIAKTGKI